MSTNEPTDDARTERGEPIQKRGLYLMADTPLTAHPVALEDGTTDRSLLVEAVAETFSTPEIGDIIFELMAILNGRSRDQEES